MYNQVDSAMKNVANMHIGHWLVSRKTRPILYHIAYVYRRIYDGLVVGGYEFGHGMVSQMNSIIFLFMGLMWEHI